MTISRIGKNLNWDEFSSDEQGAIASELSRRINETIPMVSLSRAVQAMKLMEGKIFNEGDLITINFDVCFLWTDILQILGGIRKKKAKRKKGDNVWTLKKHL
jgi:hypothetical protein